MEYTALIFGENRIEDIKKVIPLFVEDEDCKQIVLSCFPDSLLELTMAPFPKTMFVRMSPKPYVAMLNGLKAVSQENVLVVNLDDPMDSISIQKVKAELEKYPAIYLNRSLQAFDTRLVMFCLQMAIEINLAIDSYSRAVEALGDTPLKYID